MGRFEWERYVLLLLFFLLGNGSVADRHIDGNSNSGCCLEDGVVY